MLRALTLCVVLSHLACTGVIDGPDGQDVPQTPSPDMHGSPAAESPVLGPEAPGIPTATPGDCAASVAPPRLRRLTQKQYRSAVRDLLGIATPTGDLPEDEVEAGFASNVVTPVEQLGLEKYVTVATDAAQKALARLTALSGCDPALKGEAACARDLAGNLGPRAYRRPLDPSEAAAAIQLFEKVRRDHPFDVAAGAVIQSFLLSPHFMYLVEPGHAMASGAGAPYAVAAWLSFFLWQTAPDDTLNRAAASGALQPGAQLRAQVDRMLRDPRARQGVTWFFAQWLGLGELATVVKDAMLFGDFDKQRAAMRQETERFVDFVVREGDGRLQTLLTAPFSFVPGSLRPYYGLPASVDASPTRVDLDASQRRGVLTHASFLAIRAHAVQTSIVHRGKFVRENLLCQSPPPPPPDVNDVAPADKLGRDASNERLADPVCGGCHRLMDPLGQSFEAYDAVGRYRTAVQGKPIDTRIQVGSTEDLDGSYPGALELLDRLASSPQVRRCVANQWSRYALARADVSADTCWETKVIGAFERSPGMTFGDLIRVIADVEVGVATTASTGR